MPLNMNRFSFLEAFIVMYIILCIALFGPIVFQSADDMYHLHVLHPVYLGVFLVAFALISFGWIIFVFSIGNWLNLYPVKLWNTLFIVVLYYVLLGIMVGNIFEFPWGEKLNSIESASWLLVDILKFPIIYFLILRSRIITTLISWNTPSET